MTNVNTPFSALPIAVGSLTGAEVLPADQGGTTKQVTAGQIAALASSGQGNSAFVVVGAVPATLPNGRRIAVGAALTLVDGGAGSTITIGTSAFTGDVTTAANSFATTISANAVTYAKIQQVSAVSILANPTGVLANVSEVTLNATLSFSGTTLQRAALTGDVTATAGSNATTIAAGAVTYAKIQNVTAARLLGNPTGAGAAPSEISLGATLAFSGTALQTAALTGDVTASANSFVTTVAKIAGTTVSGTTGTTNVVFSASPTLTGSPILSTPSATTLAVGTITSPNNSTFSVSSNTATWSGAIAGANNQLQMIAADGSEAAASLDSFANLSLFALRRANGTAASATAVGANDTIGGLFGYAYRTSGGNGYNVTSAVELVSNETQTSTSAGARIAFFTVANTTTTFQENMRLSNSGGLSVGTANVGTDIGSAGVLATDLYSKNASFMIRTKATLTNGSSTSTATLTNSPVIGNPTKWFSIDDNGVTRQMPAW